MTQSGVANSTGAARMDFDPHAVRSDFPILRRQVHEQPLVYLDNAATTQKPQVVLDALTHYYEQSNSNIHRGVHTLSQEATEQYEDARHRIQRFLNAPRREEIIFVRGTTEAINLVAHAYALPTLKAGDEVLITHMEHHSNIVPWQMVCEATGAMLKVAAITDAGELDMDAFEKLLSPRTKIVSVVHVSNALGTVNPVRQIIEKAHAVGAVVLIDGAQAVPHVAVDVEALGCDFYCFSGHKLYGPTGIGALYGRRELLESMRPWQGGGDMIASVSFEKTTYADLPYKFEAGTPHVAGGIGMGAALAYFEQFDIAAIAAHEHAVLEYATAAVGALDEVRLIGTAADKAGVLSFTVDDIHPHDVGTILDQQGIAVRTGHHCAQPVMDRYGVPATVRASLGLYNTTEEIDALVRGLQETIAVFR
jgi:cysteine desulfurase / selenocysteine lyase